MCILLGMGDQSDKVDLKNIKLFRIILKKKISLIFFKNFGGAKAPLGPADHPPLLISFSYFNYVIYFCNFVINLIVKY